MTPAKANRRAGDVAVQEGIRKYSQSNDLNSLPRRPAERKRVSGKLANAPSGPPGNDCAAEVGGLNGAVGKGEYQTSSAKQSHRRARTARWLPFREGLAIMAARRLPADASPEPRPRGFPDIRLFAPKLAQPGWVRFYRAEGGRR